jgi:antitoxin component of MazEF toxin-antitoxin module
MIRTTQKIIGIGTSEGITIPPKELAKLGAKRGDELKITAELVKKTKTSKHTKLMREYNEFVKQYGQTLQNLADR